MYGVGDVLLFLLLLFGRIEPSLHRRMFHRHTRIAIQLKVMTAIRSTVEAQ